MITLTCAKCGTTLRVDDGFAGGVCRCSRCGTIQTVPAAGATTASSPIKTSSVSKPVGQTIYERSGRAAGTDHDLAQLGEVVTSSGAFANGVTGARPMKRRRDPTVDVDPFHSRPHPRAHWPIVLAIVAAALVAAGVGVGLWLGGANHGDAAAAVNAVDEAATAGPSAPAAVPNGPRFGTIPLTELAPVIYLVDRNAATRNAAPAIRAAILRSAATLRAPRTFQIRYVAPAGEPFAAFPPNGPQVQSSALLVQAGNWFDEVPAASPATAGDVAASLEAALAQRPGEIVFVTAHAGRLDDAFATRASAALTRAPEVRFHTLAIGPRASTGALPALVEQSKGQLVVLEGSDLTEFARR